MMHDGMTTEQLIESIRTVLGNVAEYFREHRKRNRCSLMVRPLGELPRSATAAGPGNIYRFAAVLFAEGQICIDMTTTAGQEQALLARLYPQPRPDLHHPEFVRGPAGATGIRLYLRELATLSEERIKDFFEAAAAMFLDHDGIVH